MDENELIGLLKKYGFEKKRDGVYYCWWNAFDVDAPRRYGGFQARFEKGMPVKISHYLFLEYVLNLKRETAFWRLFQYDWERKRAKRHHESFADVISAMKSGSFIYKAKGAESEVVKEFKKTGSPYIVFILKAPYSNAVISAPAGTLVIDGVEWNDEAFRYKEYSVFFPEGTASPEKINSEYDILALFKKYGIVIE